MVWRKRRITEAVISAMLMMPVKYRMIVRDRDEEGMVVCADLPYRKLACILGYGLSGRGVG